MPESKAVRAYNITVATLMTICLALSGWALRSVINLQVTVRSLEERQFSKDNGLEVWKEIGTVRKDIAFMSNSGPPKWFVDRVSKLEDQLIIINEKMDRHISVTIKPQF